MIMVATSEKSRLLLHFLSFEYICLRITEQDLVDLLAGVFCFNVSIISDCNRQISFGHISYLIVIHNYNYLIKKVKVINKIDAFHVSLNLLQTKKCDIKILPVDVFLKYLLLFLNTLSKTCAESTKPFYSELKTGICLRRGWFHRFQKVFTKKNIFAKITWLWLVQNTLAIVM